MARGMSLNLFGLLNENFTQHRGQHHRFEQDKERYAQPFLINNSTASYQTLWSMSCLPLRSHIVAESGLKWLWQDQRLRFPRVFVQRNLWYLQAAPRS